MTPPSSFTRSCSRARRWSPSWPTRRRRTSRPSASTRLSRSRRRRRGEGGEHRAHRRVVARESVSPPVAHAIARSEHEEAALLNRIAPPHALPEAGPEGAQAFQYRPRVEGFAPAIGEAGGPEG